MVTLKDFNFNIRLDKKTANFVKKLKTSLRQNER